MLYVINYWDTNVLMHAQSVKMSTDGTAINVPIRKKFSTCMNFAHGLMLSSDVLPIYKYAILMSSKLKVNNNVLVSLSHLVTISLEAARV